MGSATIANRSVILDLTLRAPPHSLSACKGTTHAPRACRAHACWLAMHGFPCMLPSAFVPRTVLVLSPGAQRRCSHLQVGIVPMHETTGCDASHPSHAGHPTISESPLAAGTRSHVSVAGYKSHVATARARLNTRYQSPVHAVSGPVWCHPVQCDSQ